MQKVKTRCELGIEPRTSHVSSCVLIVYTKILGEINVQQQTLMSIIQGII